MNMKNLYLLESLHKYLNDNIKIHVIFGFVTKSCFFVTYKNFCYHPVITNTLKHILCPFHTNLSTFIHMHKVAKKLIDPMCIVCTHNHMLWQYTIIVSLSYPYIIHLSLTHNPNLKKLATKLVVLKFWRCVYMKH